MELFGLIFAVPVTLATSTVFCLLASWAFQRVPILHSPVIFAASIVLLSVFLELILSIAVGPLELHRRFDLIHSIFHFTNFILAPPAIACIVRDALMRWGIRPLSLRSIAIGVCWFACMASLLGNIVMDEAIHGIDGSVPPSTQTR